MSASQIVVGDDRRITARVRPVFLPVGEYDERIAIAVVGVDLSGTYFAHAVASHVMRCLPESLAHACFSFGKLVTTDYLDWCSGGRRASDWTPPLVGLGLGDTKLIDAFDIQSLGALALEMCALFNADHEKEADSDETLYVAPRSTQEARFLDSVVTEVGRRAPQLVAGFRRAFSLTGKTVGSEVDFVGVRYATCFAAMDPRSRGPAKIQTASAALWRLARARDAFGFAAPNSIELTAWVPAPGQPIFSERDYSQVEEVVTELREQAKREELGLFTATDHLIASDHLLHMESPEERGT
jgi:hypothetical protein